MHKAKDSRTETALAAAGIRVGDRVNVRGLMHPPGPATVLGVDEGRPAIRRRGPRPVLVRLSFADREDVYAVDRLMLVEEARVPA